VAAERAGDVARQAAEIDRLLLQLQRAALRQGERSQVLDQARQHVRLLEQLLQLAFVAWIHAVEQPFELALHHGQRRPQLVRHVEMTRRCRHSWRRATRAPAHRTPRTAASPRPARRTAGRTGHASRTHEGQDRGEATVRSAATTAACTVGRMVFASSLLRVTLLYTARPELVEGRAANRLMVRS